MRAGPRPSPSPAPPTDAHALLVRGRSAVDLTAAAGEGPYEAIATRRSPAFCRTGQSRERGTHGARVRPMGGGARSVVRRRGAVQQHRRPSRPPTPAVVVAARATEPPPKTRWARIGCRRRSGPPAPPTHHRASRSQRSKRTAVVARGRPLVDLGVLAGCTVRNSNNVRVLGVPASDIDAAPPYLSRVVCRGADRPRAMRGDHVHPTPSSPSAVAAPPRGFTGRLTCCCWDPTSRGVFGPARNS